MHRNVSSFKQGLTAAMRSVGQSIPYSAGDSQPHDSSISFGAIIRAPIIEIS
jgi:hypothetical protein